MKKFLLSIVIFLSVLVSAIAQETFTFTYAGTNPNLVANSATVNDNIIIDFTDNSSFYAEANAEVYIHLWIPGTTYGSDFNALDANRKLTKIADNHYKIELNIRDVLGIPVGTNVNDINFLLRNQWGGGGNNQTVDMSLDLVDAQVASPNPPSIIATTTPTPLKEDNLDGATLNLTLENETFADNNLDKNNFTLQNAPVGVSIMNVNYTDATNAVATLSFDHTDFDTSISNFGIEITATELSSNTALSVKDIAITALEEELQLATVQALTEENLGGATINLTLLNETFEDANLDLTNFILENAPNGTTIHTINYVDESNATLELAFDGTDFDIDVTNFGITVKKAELKRNNADLSKDNLTITAVVEDELTIGKVTISPSKPTRTEQVTITLDATGTDLAGQSKVYFHSGVGSDAPDSHAFDHAKGNWGQDDGVGEMTSLGNNKWQIVLSDIDTYYSLTNDDDAFALNFLFRNADGSKKEDNGGANYHVEIKPGNYFLVTKPTSSPHLVEKGVAFPIEAEANKSVNWTLDELNADGTVKTSGVNTQTNVQNYTFNHTLNDENVLHKFKLTADFGGGIIKSKTFEVKTHKEVPVAPLPTGVKKGINYNADGTITFVLHTPVSTTYTYFDESNCSATSTATSTKKEVVYLIGDFNNWQTSDTYLLNRTTDSDYWHITLPKSELANLRISGAKESVFQYLVDGDTRIGDPYTNQVSDPSDQHIDATVYPNLIAYPQGKTIGIASVVYLEKPAEYIWKTPVFNRVKERNELNVYELHFRDFTPEGTYKAATAKLDYIKELGITCIHVMPVSEFEGNDSWGYNPNYYFAADKAYGTPNDLKEFIDEAHQRGIAVVNDLVLNHAFYSNPNAMLYWDKANNRPATDNPWFNPEHKGIYADDGHWGADWNHGSEHTRAMVDDIINYWMNEFHFDGFRFDFTKGFTQKNPNPSDPWASGKDACRIEILKRMANTVWANTAGTGKSPYVIFEHLANDKEDKELADFGVLLWSGATVQSPYMEMAMGTKMQGVDEHGNPNGITIYNSVYKSRNFDYANYMSYMESHDEERVGYKVKQWGANKPAETDPAYMNYLSNRLKLAATFNMLLPGPRMVWQFGELGYDISIDENGRTGRKPNAWDLGYDTDTERQEIYRLYQLMFKLRNTYKFYPAESEPQYDNIGSTTEWQRKMRFWAPASANSNLNKTIQIIPVGNFDTTNDATITPQYDSNLTGTWFKYNGDPAVDGTPYTVNSPSDTYDLPVNDPIYILTNADLIPPKITPETISVGAGISTCYTVTDTSLDYEYETFSSTTATPIEGFATDNSGTVHLYITEINGTQVTETFTLNGNTVTGTQSLKDKTLQQGTNTVHWVAVDDFGNTAECNQTINVCPTSDLIISEYTDPVSGEKDKMVELYNGTCETIDLSQYKLGMYQNGGSTMKVKVLEGAIASGESKVFSYTTPETYTGAVKKLGTALRFNGNDPIILLKNDVVIDMLGVMGGSYFAKDITLRRKNSVTAPVDTYNVDEWEKLKNASEKIYTENIGKKTPLLHINDEDNVGHVIDKKSICEGASVTFTANGLGNYEFYVNGEKKQDASTTDTFTTTDLKNNDVVTVKLLNGTCQYTDEGITMEVAEAPTATVSATESTICSGENAVFTITGTASSVVTYTLESATQTLTLSDAGTATVTVTAATVSQTLILTHIKEPVAGCEKDLTASATVTVTPKITPTFDPVAAICEGESFTLPTTSTNSVTGTWSPAVNNTTTTEYTFTPDAGQCAGTATMTVTVTPKVTPTFDQVATICEGESFTLPTTSTNNITGTWSPEVNNTTTTEYTFTPDAGQCAGTATMTVTVTPKVTPTFDQVAAICEGESFTLPTTSTNSVTGTWSPAVNNTTTTEYTFTPDAGQCAGTTTMTVTVTPKVTPTFDQVAAICEGEGFTLPTTSTNSVTGTWSPAVNNTTTTEYTFTPDAGQCAGTATMTVTVTPKITPTFDPVATICEGESFTLPTTSTNSVTGTWSPAVNNTTTTEYTFTPDAGQCAGTATMTVTVTPKVTPIFDQVDPICEGDNIILPNTSTNSITGTWSLTSSTSKYKNYTFIPNAGQCAGTATMKVKVNKLPNNGKTSGFKGDEICKGEEATLTFNAIDGSFTTPYSIIYKVQGGTKTWTQSIDIKGEFSFTVPVKPMETTVYELVSISNATCTRTTDFGRATAKIEVIEPANAGENGTMMICNGTIPTEKELFEALERTPDTGGTWTNTGNIYTYTVKATSPCTTDASATVTVTKVESANAGTDGTLTICEGTTPTESELFDALGGTPATGGTWTNTGNVYTYTVSGTAPCGDTSAIVTVTVEKLPNNGKTSGFKGSTICKGEEATLSFDAINGSFTTPYKIVYKAQGGTTTWTQSISDAGKFSFTVPVKPTETTVYELVSISNATCTRTTDFGRATAKVTVQEAPNAGENATLTICSDTTPTEKELFAALGGTPDTGGTWTNTDNIYTYTVKAKSPCTDDAKATVTVNKIEGVNAGTDGTLPICEGTTPTEEELFKALGGNPTAGGTWTNTGNVYTYTVKGTAPCGDSSAKVTVTVNKLPNNGKSSGFKGSTICKGDEATLSFDALNGSFTTPYSIVYKAQGGTTTWTQSISDAGSVTFTVPVKPMETTVYELVSISNATCTRTTDFGRATAKVTVQEAPNAGENATLTICSDTTPTEDELFAALGGNPDTGGTWTNTGNVYTYVVKAKSPCTTDASATVTVNKVEGVNAGTDGTLSVCEGTTPTEDELFDALGGNPTAGGTWTHTDNVYTYTVKGTAPCGDSSAKVTVTVNKLPNNGKSSGFKGSTICKGDEATLSFDALNGSFTTPYSIVYKAQGGTTTWTQSISDTGSVTFTVPVKPTETTVYELVSISNATCTRTTDFGRATAKVTVQEAPNAGENATLTICSDTTPTEEELFAALGGNPDTGGTWTNTGNVYTYTVKGTAPCGDTSAKVTVTVNKLPNNGKSSGFKGSTICKGDEATLSFDAINGSFTTPYSIVYKAQGGTTTWTQSISDAGSVTFTVPVKPTETTVYELVAITNTTCTRTTDFGRATAKVTVTNAGTDGTLTVCQGVIPTETELFNALGDNPDKGGVWTNIGNIYTYTVNPKNPCTATVTVLEIERITPTFTQIVPICKGEIFSLPTTSTNNITGTWSPEININKTTEYTFTPNEGQCANTVTMTVTVKPTPNTPIIEINEECGQSILTAKNYTGNLTWSTGETAESITVTSDGIYTVVQNVNGCESSVTSTTVTIKQIPNAPTIEVNKECGKTILTATNYTGRLKWNTGENTESITVTTDGNYTLTQTVDDCESPEATVNVTVKKAPNAPVINETKECGKTILTATNYTGTLKWSTGENTESITVTTDGTYTLTQTVDDCESPEATVNVTVKKAPNAPVINVTNKYGESILTASNYTGSLLWSTGETTESIIVTQNGVFSLTQTVNGCESPEASTTVTVKDELNVNISIKTEINKEVEIYLPKIYKDKGIDFQVEQVNLITQPKNGQVEINDDGTIVYTPNENFIGSDSFSYEVCDAFGDCVTGTIVVTTICPRFETSLTVPQFISLNGDKQNDSWEIPELKVRNVCNQSNRVMIFNRYGAKVWEKENYMRDELRFDAYSNNSLNFGKGKLPAGTYFYVIVINNEVKKSGYLYLME